MYMYKVYSPSTLRLGTLKFDSLHFHYAYVSDEQCHISAAMPVRCSSHQMYLNDLDAECAFEFANKVCVSKQLSVDKQLSIDKQLSTQNLFAIAHKMCVNSQQHARDTTIDSKVLVFLKYDYFSRHQKRT